MSYVLTSPWTGLIFHCFLSVFLMLINEKDNFKCPISRAILLNTIGTLCLWRQSFRTRQEMELKSYQVGVLTCSKVRESCY